MRSWKLTLLWLALVAMSSAQSSTSATTSNTSAARLPATRVVLYKNGIGYFEHSGRVHGNQDVNIDFTTAQLNDVLKSLTVLDLGKGRITNVSYNSTAPLERQLGSLRLGVGENPTTAQFLGALRGARLEVRSGAVTATGRLLSIDERDVPTKGDEKITVDQISIVSDSGEVRVFDLNPSTSVRIAEKEVNEEVGKYMGLVASTRDQDVRHLAISTAGDGERDLLVSYISEVPIWKCTYRIVVPKDGKPLLQGWAIVDNTVGEDWKNVELSLVAGAPVSFVQQLSQPYYSRRPVVPLPENAMLTPQTHEATMEQSAMLQAPPPPPAASPEVIQGNGAPAGIPGGQMGGVIGGIVSGSGGGIGSGQGAGIGPGHGGGIGGETVKRLRNRNEDVAYLVQANGVAQTQELGDLFEYQLKDLVTIRKNQSALVPILQTRIDAEKVSVWNPADASIRRALWVNNTSDLTLDGGSFNVLEGDAFAGEGLTDLIKPGEKRLLSYAADPGVLVEAKQTGYRQKVTKVFIARGMMTQTTQERQEQTYTIRNRDASARVIVIEHPARPDWTLVDTMEPAETSASYHRFRVNADPQKTETLTVKEFRPISNQYQLNNLTDDEIALFISQGTINAEVEKELRRVVAQKNAIAALDTEIASRKGQLSAISQDQQRVRENMKALKGSPEEKALIERYARELNDQEDRVQSLQRESKEVQQKRDEAQKALNEMIEGLQLDVTL
jgi:hypothetical protein